MTAARVLAYVRRYGPVTCATVAEEFGVSCEAAGACLRLLRVEGRVRSRGNTRGTTYEAR
jgi:hypothetical protein